MTFSFIIADGLGYHDDGEETYSDQENNNAKRQSAVAAGFITSKALKGARRDKAFHNKKASSNALDKKDEDGKNQSMWDFVQTCSADAVIPSKPSRVAPKMEHGSLLDTLDNVGTSIANHSSRRLKKGSLNQVQPKRANSAPKRRYGTVQRHNIQEHLFRGSPRQEEFD